MQGPAPVWPSSNRALLRRAGRAGSAGLLLLLLAAQARAIEFFDGRVQIHGFAETQLRAIARDYQIDELDLTQWYLIGNVEVELDIAPEGFGPIDLLGAFVRVEGRYDCVWTRACGIFNSVNTYGDRAQRLPGRLSDARKNSYRSSTLNPSAVRIDDLGNTFDFRDRRTRIGIPLGQDGDEFAVGPLARPVPRKGHVGRLWNFPSLTPLFFGLSGLDPDGVDGNRDPIMDPGEGDDDIEGCLPENVGAPGVAPCRYAGAYVTEEFLDYRFGTAKIRGAFGGTGSSILGPWRPKDEIISWGSLADRVNPYNVDEVNPVMVGPPPDYLPISGLGELPYRPRARFAADSNGDGVVDRDDRRGPAESRGLYYPSGRLAEALSDPDFELPSVNFSQTELSFNRGDAQQQTGELKEAYLDIELLDHALWLRAGRQTIVWGKTELFRSQDQFNPQDLGLSSLPSLEESRLPLWALRAIYSLYDLGPFEDVRIEGAVLIDEYQPLDFGRCGEPYAPNEACTLAAGLFGHGLVGLGVAGQFLPNAPWDEAGDLEAGLRLEWRWNRLSFAATGYFGYPDLPHVEILQGYDRNVDPVTGRPRKLGAGGPCTTGNEAACLGTVFRNGMLVSGGTAGLDPDDPANTFYPGLARPDRADVLANQPANQTLFAAICAATVKASDLLPEACAFNQWNSQDLVPSQGPVQIDISFAQAFSAMLQGQGFAQAGLLNGKVVYANLARWTTDGELIVSSTLSGEAQEDLIPLVPLHANTNDLIPGFQTPVDGSPDNPFAQFFRAQAFEDTVCADGPADCYPVPFRNRGLSPTLTDEQEALLGCGDYWGTDCDIHGFDLLNAEASALVQSWPATEGAGGTDWDPFDGTLTQPGTIGFADKPTCTRFDRRTGGTYKLPGCRGVLEVDRPGNPMLPGAVVSAVFEPGYDVTVDGCVFAPQIGGLDVVGSFPDGSPVDLSRCTAGPGQTINTLYHPFAGCPALAVDITACTFSSLAPGTVTFRDFDSEFLDGNAQIFSSEMAALSWNLLMVLVGASLPPDKLGGSNGPNCRVSAPKESDGCSDRPPRFDEFDVNDPVRLDGCSYRRPFLCKNAVAFLATTAPRRATVRAGGNDRFGRRDFAWHSGGVGALDYTRRNVLGFSADFPEDTTKTNWGLEFTWFDRVRMANNDEFDGLTTTQHFNLSLSVDRPTFVRFLNASRTFLFNAQVFFQYIDGYEDGFQANGPFNTTVTLLAATAYHQDRLIPTLTLVHDFTSISGAAIFGVTYRYTTQFSVGVGAAAFYGRTQARTAPLVGIAGAGGGAGEGRNRAYVDNGLSSIRDRDEIFLRFRYTF